MVYFVLFYIFKNAGLARVSNKPLGILNLQDDFVDFFFFFGGRGDPQESDYFPFPNAQSPW